MSFVRAYCQHVWGRLSENSRGYLNDFRLALLLVILCALADSWSTTYFMLRDGIEHEVHPVVRFSSLALGPFVGPLLGKTAQLAAIVLVTLYWRHLARYVFFAA